MINSIWAPRQHRKVKEITLGGRPAWRVPHYFNRPDLVLNFFRSRSAPLWKAEQRPSRNGLDFVDRRHNYSDRSMTDLDLLVNELTGQHAVKDHTLFTNWTRLLPNDYNMSRYRSHYWYPHRDTGYTAIIYFDTDRTNIYQELEPDPYHLEGRVEHDDPWRPKRYYQLLDQVQGEINTLVIFDGTLIHGMAVEDPTNIFHTPRFNICQFYQAAI